MKTVSELCAQLTPEDFHGHLIVPTSWTPANGSALYPLPSTYVWESLCELVKEYNVTKSILVAVPIVWQMQYILQNTAKALSLPLCAVPLRNLSAIKPYADTAGVDVIITTPEALSEISEILSHCDVKPKLIVTVSNRSNNLIHTSVGFDTVEEIHLLPGLPLLSRVHKTNDSNIALNKPFEKKQLFVWDEVDGSTVVHGPQDWPMVLNNIGLPSHLSGSQTVDADYVIDSNI